MILQLQHFQGKYIFISEILLKQCRVNSGVYLGKMAATLNVSLPGFGRKASDLVNMSMVLHFIPQG